jgi:hypothetical protein
MPVPTWIPKMIDSGTPSTTEPTTMPIAPPTPAWPKRLSTTRSATRKTAMTPTRRGRNLDPAGKEAGKE